MAKYECPFAVGDIVVFMEPSEHEKKNRPGWNEQMAKMVGTQRLSNALNGTMDTISSAVTMLGGHGKIRGYKIHIHYFREGLSCR